MTSNPSSEHRMARLLSRIHDGVASEAEQEWLEMELATNSQARRFWIEFMAAEAAAAALLCISGEPSEECRLIDMPRVFNSTRFATAPEISNLRGKFTGSIARRSKTMNHLDQAASWHRHPVRTVAVLATLLCVIGAVFLLPDWSRQPPDFVAKLRSLDARWENDPLQVFDGARLRSGQILNLTEGLAEIQFQSGVLVSLEGPAKFCLRGDNAGTLDLGRLVARVPQHAHGFTVTTPSLRVVDLGTEFGIAIDRDGSAHIQVFEGVVEASWQNTAGEFAKPRKFKQGDSLRFDSQSPPTASKPRSFVRTVPKVQRIATHGTGQGLLPNETDPHWQLIKGPEKAQIVAGAALVARASSPAYLQSEPSQSQWISSSNATRGTSPGTFMPEGTYTFRYELDLSGFDPSTVRLTACYLVDDQLTAIRLNGHSVPLPSGSGWQEITNLTIREGFTVGKNTIEFDVFNKGTGVNPMALRVQLKAFGRPFVQRDKVSRQGGE